MKKDKLLKTWNKKASGDFKEKILKDLKNEILKHNTLLSYDIDNLVYKCNDLIILNEVLKEMLKSIKRFNKIVKGVKENGNKN